MGQGRLTPGDVFTPGYARGTHNDRMVTCHLDCKGASDCNNQGKCKNYECVCNKRFTGRHCKQAVGECCGY